MRIRHPKPTGSRRATPTSLFQHAPGHSRVERKHKVAVARAARNVISKDPDWTIWRSESQGSTVVIVNQASLQSHCLAWLMTESGTFYRSPARAKRCWPTHQPDTRAELLAKMGPGQYHHNLPQARRKFVELHIAKRD